MVGRCNEIPSQAILASHSHFVSIGCAKLLQILQRDGALILQHPSEPILGSLRLLMHQDAQTLLCNIAAGNSGLSIKSSKTSIMTSVKEYRIG